MKDLKKGVPFNSIILQVDSCTEWETEAQSEVLDISTQCTFECKLVKMDSKLLKYRSKFSLIEKNVPDINLFM